jgi:hypothetical protein
MFDFFRTRTAKDYLKEAKEIYNVPEVKTKSKECYRVGCDDEGNTTLTFLSDHGMSVTLIMDQQACEKMIRMLRATYTEEQPTENE